MNSDFTGNIRENKVFDERRRKSTITKILSSVAGLSTRLDEENISMSIYLVYIKGHDKKLHTFFFTKV